jgi:hypothetical protein
MFVILGTHTHPTRSLPYFLVSPTLTTSYQNPPHPCSSASRLSVLSLSLTEIVKQIPTFSFHLSLLLPSCPISFHSFCHNVHSGQLYRRLFPEYRHQSQLVCCAKCHPYDSYHMTSHIALILSIMLATFVTRAITFNGSYLGPIRGLNPFPVPSL